MDIVFDYIFMREKNNDPHCHTIRTMETVYFVFNIEYWLHDYDYCGIMKKTKCLYAIQANRSK